MVDIDWSTIITSLLCAGGVYGGIRADLRNMKERIDNAERSVTRAHERIDDFLNSTGSHLPYRHRSGADE